MKNEILLCINAKGAGRGNETVGRSVGLKSAGHGERRIGLVLGYYSRRRGKEDSMDRKLIVNDG